MHARLSGTLLLPFTVTQSACSLKLAAATADRVVHVFDENGDKKDKFKTKAADPNSSNATYLVKGLAFSPDSTKLAVAQSDNIVFVYRSALQLSFIVKQQQPASLVCHVQYTTCCIIITRSCSLIAPFPGIARCTTTHNLLQAGRRLGREEEYLQQVCAEQPRDQPVLASTAPQ